MSTTLNTEKRALVGTRHSRTLRSAGRIPASLQSKDEKPQVSISIDEEEFLTARRRHEHVFTLSFSGESASALVDELQWDTFGERIVHVEFRRVDLEQKTEVEVRLEFYGHAKEGGLVNHILMEVSVLAKPEEIPDSIEVKVDGLTIGTVITAGDLILPPGVELAVEADLVLAHIAPPEEEEEPVDEEPELGVTGLAPTGPAAEGEKASD